MKHILLVIAIALFIGYFLTISAYSVYVSEYCPWLSGILIVSASIIDLYYVHLCCKPAKKESDTKDDVDQPDNSHVSTDT